MFKNALIGLLGLFGTMGCLSGDPTTDSVRGAAEVEAEIPDATGRIGNWLITKQTWADRNGCDGELNDELDPTTIDPVCGDDGSGVTWVPYRGVLSRGDWISPCGSVGACNGGRSSVDFNCAYGGRVQGPPDNQSAYAMTYLVVDRDREVLFQTGGDDAYRIWIDGAQVLHSGANCQCFTDSQRRFTTRLTAGVHRLLVQTSENSGHWGFVVRALDPASGKPIGDGSVRAVTEFPGGAGASEGTSGIPAPDCGGGDDDGDDDGVPKELDCDDEDSTVGELLHDSDFDFDDGWFRPTPHLPGPWGWDSSTTYALGGGQQVQLGVSKSWTDVVVYATVSSRGTESNCGHEDGEAPCGSDDRWRAGIVARAAADHDQDEGFHGYRCALASNAANGCFEDGLFLQLSEFVDAPEDTIPSECDEDCPPNTTFEQIARENHDGLDLSDGETGYLTFYVVGQGMYCAARSADGDQVAVRGSDDSFASGTVALSTLNMYGEFDAVRVCQAFALPE